MSRSGGGGHLRLPLLLGVVVHGLYHDALRRTPLVVSDNLERPPCLTARLRRVQFTAIAG